jgi:DNA-binding protein HU-beta
MQVLNLLGLPWGNAGVDMNKRDLIDAISGRLGDKKSATEALNAVLDTIQSAVASGDKVAITGFGVFEKSERPARTARNPATGAEIQVAASSVPKFRAGADFKALVNGDKAGAKPAAKAASKPAAKTAARKK